MKIVLLGYMGSGKSTVGQILGQSLHMPFTDLDAYITSELQADIPTLFRTKGELFFRKKEHEFLGALLNQPGPTVLALGGGTPCYSGNMDLILDRTPLVFYLMLSVPDLVQRLQPEKANRPLIRDIPDDELGVFIGKHLFERRTFYEQATHTIACAGKTPEEIAGEIEVICSGQ